MILKEVFEVVQGHQITDEELYLTPGTIPVITGKNEIKGYWDKEILKDREYLPCITYPTKANSGEAYVQTRKFDANNTALLIPRKEWKEKIDLWWLCYKLPNIFLKIQTSKDGVSYLNKTIVEELEIDIPPFQEQQKIMDRVQVLLTDERNVDATLSHIRSTKRKLLVSDYKNYQVKNIPVGDVIDSMGGNSGLTEELIYQKSQQSGKRYLVLSSSTTEDTKLGEVPLCKINGKRLKVFEDKEGLLVIRKGKAGKTRFLNKGKYTINDDAYILSLTDSSPYDLSLKWFSIQYKDEFLQFSSSSDNGTWNKTGFFKNVRIDIPDYTEQTSIVNAFEKLDRYESKLQAIRNHVEELLSRQVVQS